MEEKLPIKKGSLFSPVLLRFFFFSFFLLHTKLFIIFPHHTFLAHASHGMRPFLETAKMMNGGAEHKDQESNGSF